MVEKYQKMKIPCSGFITGHTVLICSFLQNSEKLLHVQNIYYHFSALIFHRL